MARRLDQSLTCDLTTCSWMFLDGVIICLIPFPNIIRLNKTLRNGNILNDYFSILNLIKELNLLLGANFEKKLYISMPHATKKKRSAKKKKEGNS